MQEINFQTHKLIAWPFSGLTYDNRLPFNSICVEIFTGKTDTYYELLL